MHSYLKAAAALAGVGLAIYVAAPNLFYAALPLLILAACPLSMFLMMRVMMPGGAQRGSSPATSADRSSEDEVASRPPRPSGG